MVFLPLWFNNKPSQRQTAMFLASLIAVAIVLVMIAGCPKQQEPLLRVATNIWPGYETLYLARSLGYYDEHQIRLIEMASSIQVSQALRNGTLEAGCLTLDETLSLMQDGVDLRVVLIMDFSHGADVVVAQRGISGLPALRGKRVGVENAAVGAIMLDAALERGGVEAKDVTIIPLTVDEHYAAFKAKKVDAVVTFEPVRTLLLKAGGMVIFDSSLIPGRIVDVLVVRPEVEAAHAQGLKILLQGHFRAIEYLATQPQDAALRMTPRLNGDALKQFMGLRLPDVQENRALLAGTAPGLLSTARALADLMLRRQLLQLPVATERLADPNYLPRDINANI